MPTASSTAVWTTLVTRTRPILPRKYAAGGIGVPRSRFSVPSSRSTAIPIASDWKLDSTMPEAIIPAVKYCVNETPPARCRR